MSDNVEITKTEEVIFCILAVVVCIAIGVGLGLLGIHIIESVASNNKKDNIAPDISKKSNYLIIDDQIFHLDQIIKVEKYDAMGYDIFGVKIYTTEIDGFLFFIDNTRETVYESTEEKVDVVYNKILEIISEE